MIHFPALLHITHRYSQSELRLSLITASYLMILNPVLASWFRLTTKRGRATFPLARQYFSPHLSLLYTRLVKK